MSILLLAWASLASGMECGTSGQLDALRGNGTAVDRERLTPRIDIHPPAVGETPPPDRTLYGTPSEFHVETEHFSINWTTTDVTSEIVDATATALEAGWQSFVEEQGWPAPVSSDAHYLWVYLDPNLGSTTGYTTEFYNADFPDGLPLIYINPANLQNFGWAFHHALCTHEFMHAIQYGMRDYNSGSSGADLENWYWEASATHASELADPSVDGHQYTSAWYADQPHERYDSYVGAHQYGMFVFNAWLEEAHGTGAMREAWALSAERAEKNWREILEESRGTPAEVLWGDFTDAYGSEALAESPLYTRARNEGELTNGASGTLDELGTAYWTVVGDVMVTPNSPDVIIGGTSAAGTALRTGGDRVVSVTALADNTTYVLTLSEPEDEPDSTEDSGTPEADETGGEGDPETSGDDRSSGAADKGGCSTVTASGSAGVWVVCGVIGFRRRKSPREL